MSKQGCQYKDLKVSPSELNFKVAEGWKFIPPQQRIFIENVGAGGMSARWTAAANEDWVRITGGSGTGSGVVRVSCSSVGKAAGIYSALIEIESSSGIQVIDPIILVTLIVEPIEVPAPPVPVPPPAPDPDPVPPAPAPPAPAPDPTPTPTPTPPTPEPHWFIVFLDWLMKQLERVWRHW